MPRFTVDTHLFRELGELLVGRDSTALIELIKNSYDADATEVVVVGNQVDDTEFGNIVIADDGVGMDSLQFETGFLRIASRLKDEGNRRSLTFGRHFTGAKGIGRLAAHKLARHIRVLSSARQNVGESAANSIDATIDWDKVEACVTLDDVAAADAISINAIPATGATTAGTTIQLSGLRRRWTPAERSRFFA